MVPRRSVLPARMARASASEGFSVGRLGSVTMSSVRRRALDELALNSPSSRAMAWAQSKARLTQSLDRLIGLFGTDTAYACWSLRSSQWLLRALPPMAPPLVVPETSCWVEQFG